jgi:serine beta-lactamase-like protein LACTB
MKQKQLVLSHMPVKVCLFIFVILISISSCSTRKRNPRVILRKAYKNEILEGREAMRIHFITSSVPGMSVSVSINGETVWSEGMGYANKELQAPAEPETKYRIGGVSRMFTTFLVAKLQEEGKLKINDSFYSYLPDFPRKQWNFTLYQLGAHTAGFPEGNTDELYKQSKSYTTLRDYVKGHSADSLLYEPDTYFMVSDYGSCLLGILAEEVAQKKFASLMKAMILDTLSLDETSFDHPLYLIDNRSQNYYQNYIAQMMNAPAIDLSFCAPAQGILSTADDLNKAGQAVMDTVFFSQESRKLFFTRHKLAGERETNAGFGWWVVQDNQDRTMYAQLGSTLGGSSMLLIYPDQKLVVSICSNVSDETGRLPAEQIARIFLKKIDPRESDLKKEGNKEPEAADQKNRAS